MKHNYQMPGYYQKNIAKNTQRKFLQRKRRERESKAAKAGETPGGK